VAELASAGVDVELPEDPESEIEALLSQGEGLQTEFKRQLPGDSVDSKRTIFKTVAAFANGHGGSIVFDVESDEATFCGLDGIDLIAERDRLAQLARAIVTPAPEVEVRPYEHEGKTLLVLTVSRGTHPPYGLPCVAGRASQSSSTFAATQRPSPPGQTRSGTLFCWQHRHRRTLRCGVPTTSHPRQAAALNCDSGQAPDEVRRHENMYVTMLELGHLNL
jgi:hypothetical protein